MTYRYIESNGVQIPKIGLGTWQSSDVDGYNAVLCALEAGYRHIDTAARYGNEDVVGRALANSRLSRNAYFVTTKVWHTNLANGVLQQSARQSLDRLGLDHVDLLLVHWPTSDIPLKETIAALCDAKRQGLTRHIGVANFPSALLHQAVTLSDEPIIANQCEYHPYLDQSAVLHKCRELDVAFISYSPLGTGILLQDPVVIKMAEKYDRTAAQVILRWHIQQSMVGAIPKSMNPHRIMQNIDIFDFALELSDVEILSGLRQASGRMVSPEWAPRWDAA